VRRLGFPYVVFQPETKKRSTRLHVSKVFKVTYITYVDGFKGTSNNGIRSPQRGEEIRNQHTDKINTNNKDPIQNPFLQISHNESSIFPSPSRTFMLHHRFDSRVGSVGEAKSDQKQP